MSIDISSHVKDMGKLEVTRRLPYIEPGYYTLKICNVTSLKSKSSGEPAVVVEFQVLATDNPKFSAGSEVAWYQGLNNVAAMPNIKNFLIAALGVDMNNPVEFADFNTNCVQLLIEAYENQSMKGLTLNVSAKPQLNKAGTFTYTKLAFSQHHG